MGAKTKIAWSEATWNFLRGCTRVSPGCVNCYAEGVSARFSGPGMAYEGFAIIKNGDARWTNKVAVVRKHMYDPMIWRRPRRIFVNSMSDTFHEDISFVDIAQAFGVMRCASRHTYQVLTKRAARMAKFFRWYGPVPENVWVGVSVEDQPATWRLHELATIPGAVRFISYEPALGALDLSEFLPSNLFDWVIAGGESGIGARNANPDWFRKVRDDCRASGVQFFMKQMGGAHDKRSDLDAIPEDLRIREYPA